MYEEFSLGIMQPPGTKKFIIADNTFTYGKKEYSYNELSKITMLVTPTPLTNGVAQVTIEQKPRNLAYKFSDRERAAQAFAFANNKIDSAHGIVKNCIYQLQAHTGTSLEVYDTYLILTFMETGSIVSNIAKGGANGGKRINFADLTAIQFKEPSGMSVGFIQFIYPGSTESKSGVIAAINDENSIPVSAQNLPVARSLVEYIEKRRNELRAPHTTVTQQISAADELKKFKELLDMGVIAQEEFDTKKNQLLGITNTPPQNNTNFAPPAAPIPQQYTCPTCNGLVKYGEPVCKNCGTAF